jgi:diguanylate cyclase (GGDEF)-like protein/PAS domain S-box-containing protein
MPPFQDPEIYRDILDGLQIGVSVLDLQKKIVFWSDGAEQITGYARIDVLGHSCTENILLHCNQNSCEMCAGRCTLAAALHDAKPAEAISSIHHRSGHLAQVLTWAIPLRDKHGSIIGIIQTFESEFAVNGPDPNHQTMKERGCLDYTTELPNHAIMQSHLREMLGTFAELQMPFGVICLEVHELSEFRARYGQEAATSMLRVLARTLRNTIWPTDFVGRWSEDRFLVILSGCGQKALQVVADRMLRMTARATIEWWGEELSVEVLIGSTAAIVDDTVETLLLRVQEALQNTQLSLQSSAAATGATSSPPVARNTY